MKVIIDRETCIGCQACGAVAPDLFFVPPGHKSLFKKDFVVYDKEKNELVKSFDNNEEGLTELSEFLGEKVILRRIVEEEKESAEMGENACPVAAIQIPERD